MYQSPYKGFNRQTMKKVNLNEYGINPPIRGSIGVIIDMHDKGFIGINPPIRGSIESNHQIKGRKTLIIGINPPIRGSIGTKLMTFVLFVLVSIPL